MTARAPSNVSPPPTNPDGEAESPIMHELADRSGPRLDSQISTYVSFDDVDALPCVVSGKVTVRAARDETGLTAYVVYLSAAPTERGEKVGEIDITNDQFSGNARDTNSDKIYELILRANDGSTGTNTAVSINSKRRYLLVFSKNDVGESEKYISTSLSDRPSISFRDIDDRGGRISGALSVARSGTDGDCVTHYALYWSHTPGGAGERARAVRIIDIPADPTHAGALISSGRVVYSDNKIIYHIPIFTRILRKYIIARSGNTNAESTSGSAWMEVVDNSTRGFAGIPQPFGAMFLNWQYFVRPSGFASALWPPPSATSTVTTTRRQYGGGLTTSLVSDNLYRSLDGVDRLAPCRTVATALL